MRFYPTFFVHLSKSKIFPVSPWQCDTVRWYLIYFNIVWKIINTIVAYIYIIFQMLRQYIWYTYFAKVNIAYNIDYMNIQSINEYYK